MQQNHKAVIVGSGGQARLVARLLSASGRCTVSCFVEASEAARDALRERRPECPVATDLAEALQEHRPDVAVVCGPVGQRAEQILACLRAGCRVLAPGPLCSNSAEAGEIVEMFRCDKSLKLVACLPDRFISPRPEAVRLAHRGQLGRLFLVENAGAIPRPAETKDDAQSQEQAEADLLFASASVPLDLIIHAARRRVEEVHAVSTGSGADATHLLCMSLEGGLAARLTLSGTIPADVLCADGFALHGTDGSIRGRRIHDASGRAREIQPDNGAANDLQAATGRLVEHFLDVIDGRCDNAATAWHAANVVAACESAVSSIRTRRPQSTPSFSTDLPHRQLHMWLTPKDFDDRSRLRGEGYVLRKYRPGDEAGILSALHLAGFDNWDSKRLKDFLEQPERTEGTHVVEKDGEVLAVTFASQEHAEKRIGCLDYVAADPAHRGHGLGCAVCSAVARYLFDRGYVRIVLATDDWRLPALMTYLRIGFRPRLYREDMAARWAAVFEKLGFAHPLVHERGREDETA